jgi:predicted CoA-binding protein
VIILSQKEIQETLQKYRTIAVVGLSSDENKPSYQVAKYLKDHYYKIVPINPNVKEVLGAKSYPSLLSLPEELQRNIEVVDIFRKSQDVLPVVEEAVQLRQRFDKPMVVWMQVGIVNYEAAKMAHQSGMVVIMDRCIKVEHRQLGLS